MKKTKGSNSDLFVSLTFALLFIMGGIIMITKDLVAFGLNSRTQMPSGFGGHLLILIGSIFLVVSYYCLSPFGKIRRFFEGGIEKGKKNKKDNSKN